MRALTLVADRKLELIDVPEPPAPGAGEVQIRIKAIGLNHLDVWGWRGMAFAKRKLPLVVGVEAAGEIAAVGSGVTAFKPGDRVVAYGGLTCGTCKACREGRDNLCENVSGVMGFHADGFARDLVNMPARLVIPVPAGVSFRDAACAPVAFGTVQHMLFDNAKLEAGETILVQAGGSGIGTAAIKMAKAIGATVFTTVGDDEKIAKAKALGADHVINYRTDRFETVGAQAHGQERRRCRVRACRARHVQRLAAVPQARRPARHLRLDLGAVDADQPVPALPAAVPHLRLVRLHDPQRARKPRQDGGGPDAGDRYRSAARRLRERPRAARRPQGVRQDHRDVLTPRDGAPVDTRSSSCGRSSAPFERVLGWITVAHARRPAPDQPPAHGESCSAG